MKKIRHSQIRHWCEIFTLKLIPILNRKIYLSDKLLYKESVSKFGQQTFLQNAFSFMLDGRIDEFSVNRRFVGDE